jgi:hypothetical protein
MIYYVITREDQVIAITFESPYSWNLPNVSISKFEDMPFPDLNTRTWDSNTTAFVKTANVYTKLEFLNRFTSQERIGIRSSTDPVVEDFMELLNAASEVDKTYPDTVAGMTYLVSVGLLTQQRLEEILA